MVIVLKKDDRFIMLKVTDERGKEWMLLLLYGPGDEKEEGNLEDDCKGAV